MNAGDLGKRIIIEIPRRSKNSMGEWIDTFVTWATVWAALEPLTGKRYMEAKQANADVFGICRTRYRPGVRPTMRLNFEGRILEIVSVVQPKENREELHIYYREKLD